MSRVLKLLLVEDNPSDAELVLRELKRGGFTFVWERVETEEDFIARLAPDIDIIISDFQLNGFTGARALQLLNEAALNVPFIIVSGTIGEDVAVEVMKGGASDYLIKDRLARLTHAVEHAIQQKASEREQRLNEATLLEQASLLDKARDAILVRDLHHRITYWNKGAETLYGWTADEARGRNVVELIYSDVLQFDEAMEHVRQSDEWMGELRQRDKSGGEVLVESRWTMLRDSTGNPKAVLAINTDIRDKKRIEAQFLRAQRMESIGTLAGGMAHDLNNVLTPITMSIDLLKSRTNDERSLEVLDTIADCARRGAEMVNSVLAFARGHEVSRQELAIAPVIDGVVKIARETFPRNIWIKPELAADLWSVQGDATQLHQVLLNLCVNARDAMPSGGQLTVTAENMMIDEPYAAMNLDAKAGPHVSIEIKDNGVGMSPEVMERIFDPFFTTKEIGKGTGLGLSTAIAIIKSHEGFVSVTSEEGNGTSFRIFLPAVESPGEVPVASKETELPRGNGETILVVDDEVTVRQITGQTLESYGYQIMLAADGAEAVSIYAKHRNEIALVLTDMMMPFMDGNSTIQVLLKMNPQLPIIAASGITPAGASANPITVGAKMLVQKPYTAGVLLRSIRQCLEAS